MEPISVSNSPMRLVEHLQEKQESFRLEAYLVERGCTTKRLYSEGSVGCFFRTRSSKNEFLSTRKKKKMSTNNIKFSEIRKTLCEKLVSIGEGIRLKRRHIGDDRIQERRKGKEAISMEETERLSTASFSTEFSSHSEIHVEDPSTSMDSGLCQKQQSHQTDKSDTDKMIQWGNLDENKQCSPDSVLDEIIASPVYNVNSSKQEEPPSTSSFTLSKKPTEESILSATLWELINRREKPGILRNNETCSGYISSKKALQQTRQLLFDCVREAVESEGRKHGMQMKTRQLIGPEKLGRIICDKMRVWNRQSANRKKINRLLRMDLMGSIQEWDDFESFRGDIVKEVGDQILEQIKDEMVEEVIDLYICRN